VFHTKVCTFVEVRRNTNRCPLTGVPVGALMVKLPIACVFACVATSVVAEFIATVVPSAITVVRGSVEGEKSRFPVNGLKTQAID
jgi:hypothetical protein